MFSQEKIPMTAQDKALFLNLTLPSMMRRTRNAEKLSVPAKSMLYCLLILKN
jgi:hypothetical protein